MIPDVTPNGVFYLPPTGWLTSFYNPPPKKSFRIKLFILNDFTIYIYRLVENSYDEKFYLVLIDVEYITVPPNFAFIRQNCQFVVAHLLTQSSVLNYPLFAPATNTSISSTSSNFHYPSQHDLSKWTFVHTTIKIGHWTLDPPALNRKSVQIPIVQKGKCTLLTIYKYRHTGVYRLFFCTFKDCNRLNMRRLWELVNWLNRFRHMVSLFSKALNITD